MPFYTYIEEVTACKLYYLINFQPIYYVNAQREMSVINA